jgi:NAD-dependent SIR2 family protein deacetylase
VTPVRDEDVCALSGFLERHPRLLVLTGAGCSAPSGIPEYRDEAGRWKHRPPMSFSEFVRSAAGRRRYWAGSRRGWPRVRDARPSGAHASLARLEALGHHVDVVSQNVDGLHQKAGSRRVIDLHGRLDTVECLDCATTLSREDVQSLLDAWNPGRGGAAPARPDGDVVLEETLDDFRVPDCRECGGVLKPAVVFFGENVPRSRVDRAMAALDAADALLVVGSSLMVYSGFRFILAARERGRPVALLNLGRTRADGGAKLKIVADCASVLPAAVACLVDGRAIDPKSHPA